MEQFDRPSLFSNDHGLDDLAVANAPQQDGTKIFAP
jgi:hypothetical protein